MGAPINDVTIPTGISDGDIIILEIVSDIRKKMSPITRLPVMEYRWSEPSSSLEIFGTINPTNEIIPAIETAEAARMEDNMIEEY